MWSFSPVFHPPFPARYDCLGFLLSLPSQLSMMYVTDRQTPLNVFYFSVPRLYLQILVPKQSLPSLFVGMQTGGVLEGLMNVVVDFRSQVRKTVLKSPDPRKDVLSLCDQIRDSSLPAIGIRLEVGCTTVNTQWREEREREREPDRDICCITNYHFQDNPKLGTVWKLEKKWQCAWKRERQRENFHQIWFPHKTNMLLICY